MAMALHLIKPHHDELTEVSDINVTPFIDVILVLLIIFMVAAPLSTVDIPVDLPASSASPQKRPEKPVYVTVKPDLSIALGGDIVSRSLLGQKLGARTGENREERIFLRADSTVPYGELVKVMNLLRDAGYMRIALVVAENTGQVPTP